MLYSAVFLTIGAIFIVACVVCCKKSVLRVGGPILFALALATVLLFVISDTVGKYRIIELDKLTSVSEKQGMRRYHYTVLVKNPPANIDSIRKMMVSYFFEKSTCVNSIDSGAHIGLINFYRYSRKTAHFIKHDEDYGGFSSRTLDMHQDQGIGFILIHYPCACDSTRYMDVMEIYGQPRDTLYWECDNTLINNWSKYKETK